MVFFVVVLGLQKGLLLWYKDKLLAILYTNVLKDLLRDFFEKFLRIEVPIQNNLKHVLLASFINFTIYLFYMMLFSPRHNFSLINNRNINQVNRPDVVLYVIVRP